MKTAIFTGSFNPFTIGHADIVERALTIFDRVVIGVGYNIDKGECTDLASRVTAIEKVYENDERVFVEAFSDLAADFAKRHKAIAIVKGVRTVQDYEYERSQAEFNKILSNGLDTVLFFSKPELSALSSSMLRTLEHFGRDISEFLPKNQL